MLKLLVLCAAALVVAGMSKKCELSKGRILTTFSGTREPIKFDCKFNAVRDTVCGKYRINISPGLILVPKGRISVYVLEKMFIGVDNVQNRRSLEGRMSIKTVDLYILRIKDSPFRKKLGSLNIEDVYNITADQARNEVTLTEQQGDFTIKFGSYNGYRTESSYFSFQCHSDTFVPTPYPTQLCGNGTVKEVQANKKALGFQGDREAVLVSNVFTNTGIIRVHSDCASAARAMTKRCRLPATDVSNYCWHLLYKGKYIKCLTKYRIEPRDAFRKCVEYSCSDFKDPDYCYELATMLDNCPNLRVVTDKIRAQCYSNMTVSNPGST